LIPREEFRREAAFTHLRHLQGEGADPCRQLTRLIAVAIPLPLVSPLIPLRLQVLADLGVEHLVEHRLQEVGELAFPAEEALQRLRMQGNLVVGHGCPLWPEGCLDNTQSTREAPPS